MEYGIVPFVSIVLPAHNRRELLKDAIESLLNQAYPKDRYEIIIIDNSSNDGSGEMVQALQQKAEGILQYHYKENKGPGSARNLGIKKAQGSIIAFTDSDCVAEQNWLQNGIARMADGVGLVQGKTLPDPNQPKRTVQQTMKVLSEDGYYQTCNIFYRRQGLEEAGCFSSEFCGLNWFGKPRWGGEDTDLAWKVKEKGWRSVFADDAVVFHHVFQVTSLKAFFRSMHLNAIFAIARNIKKHPEMRKAKLYRKVFKSKQRALFYIFVLSLLAGAYIHWGFFLFGFPYAAKLFQVCLYGRPIGSCHRGIALFGTIIVVELIESILSMCASMVYRTIIL